MVALVLILGAPAFCRDSGTHSVHRNQGPINANNHSPCAPAFCRDSQTHSVQQNQGPVNANQKFAMLRRVSSCL